MRPDSGQNHSTDSDSFQIHPAKHDKMIPGKIPEFISIFSSLPYERSFCCAELTELTWVSGETQSLEPLG
jgi:hypothetical protein